MQVALAVHEKFGQALHDGCANQCHPLIFVNWPVAGNGATDVRQSQDADVSAEAAHNAISQKALGVSIMTPGCNLDTSATYMIACFNLYLPCTCMT